MRKKNFKKKQTILLKRQSLQKITLNLNKKPQRVLNLTNTIELCK